MPVHNKIHFFFFLLVFGFASPALAQEGLTISKINFKGNQTFSSTELMILMELSQKKHFVTRLFSGAAESSRYSEYVLQRDLNRIINFYKTEGFLHAKIDSFHLDFKENEADDGYSGIVKVDIFLTEGEPVFIDRVQLMIHKHEFDANNGFSHILRLLKKEARRLTKKRFRDQDLIKLKSNIINAFNNRGYPFASVAPDAVLDPAENAVTVKMLISPGQLVTFGEVEIIGNKKVTTSLIRKQLTIKPGRKYQIKRIRKSRQQVYNLGVFSIVTFKILTEKMQNNSLPVQVIVKEAPRLTTRFGAGWGRDDRFRGFFEQSQLGFLGGARKQRLFVKHSFREPVTIDWEMIQPAVWGPRNNLSIKPFYRRQREESFDAERIGQMASLFRIMAGYTRGSLAYTLERVRTQFQDFDELYTKSSVTMHIYRDNAKPMFTPNRGMYSSVIFTLSGLGFNSRTFGKIQLEAKRYREVFSRVVFAYKARAGYGFVYGKNREFPQEELFYAGGSTSVRGWYRSRLGPYFPGTTKPRGGVNLFEGSTEVRFPVWKEFGAVIFLDFGNVWNDKYSDILKNNDEHKIRFAAGLGLRYLTPIGPIRFDFGREVFNTSGNNREIAFHISIGQAF